MYLFVHLVFVEHLFCTISFCGCAALGRKLEGHRSGDGKNYVKVAEILHLPKAHKSGHLEKQDLLLKAGNPGNPAEPYQNGYINWLFRL